MPVITDIADAVVATLKEANFGEQIEAKRHYVPNFDLPEMKQLHVSVVPKGVTTAALGRSNNQHDYAVDIGVQKKLTKADNSELDGLLGLAEQVADHFRLKRLDSYPNAIWVKTEHKPIYFVDHIEQLRQFTSIVTVTFRVIR